MIPGIDNFLSLMEAIVNRVLIHSIYRRRITGVAMLLSSFTMVVYSLDPNGVYKEEPLLWLAWILIHGLFWFFAFLLLCLIATYLILKEHILSFAKEIESGRPAGTTGEEMDRDRTNG